MTWKPDYITVDDLAAYLRINDDADDTELELAIGAASRAIDAYCNRQFGNVAEAETRQYAPECRVVDIDDLYSADGLIVEDENGNALTGFTLGPVNAPADGEPYTRLVLASTVTGRVSLTSDSWGWSSVPRGIELACRLQSSRFHARRESPYGVAGSPEAGNELRLLARVDPDVAVMLRPFRRPRKVM